MNSSLEVRGLSKEFLPGSSVLSDLRFAVPQGSVFSLVGRSGSGKSTLLDIIAGVTEQTAGEFVVSGPVSYFMQGDYLLPWRTAIENSVLPLELEGRICEERLEEAQELFRALGLGGSEDKFPDELSGGMKQRVALARLLLEDRELLLLDEPFSAIDFHERVRVGEELRRWIKERGKSAVFVTHNIDEAISLGDSLAVLSGRTGAFCYETGIELREEEREGSSIRETCEFQRVFRETWKMLEAR